MSAVAERSSISILAYEKKKTFVSTVISTKSEIFEIKN